ncbi:MAG: nucleotidyltransferase domain-containing protein [Marinobacter sp.]|uniref:nucleotidyltransferase domain-containing protein n=1 Tax=Marinobacter sp. TaxID=50741 RepID=UPI0034A03186
MAQASEQELTNVTLALQRFPDIVLAAVFGSIIKGGATPDSDIDIAVLTKTPMISADRIALIEAITLATGRAVDLIDLRESDHFMDGSFHGQALALPLRVQV